MALKVKTGVEFVIAPAGIAILQCAKAVSKMLNLDLTITSGADGEHSGLDDPHHKGEAYDFRTHDLSVGDKQRVLTIMKNQLGSGFFGFLEDSGNSNEHIHFQLVKGTQFDIERFIDE